MNINGKEVKSIRLMTNQEKLEYDADILLQNIYCIEFIDESLLLPKRSCISCMINDQCLFSLIPELQ